MSEPLTACVIGASGRMGREHVAAYEACGIIVSDDLTPNIVSIATPDWFHAHQARRAFQQDSHVFCEKPLYTTKVDGMIVRQAMCDRHVGQNFPLRHQPIFKELKYHDFGEIYRIEASYNWGRTHKLFEGWRAKDPNYSLVMGGLIHMVD
ncbi:hypothetical protein LCGC14_3000530, partial [marine sediment metagenome]